MISYSHSHIKLFAEYASLTTNTSWRSIQLALTLALLWNERCKFQASTVVFIYSLQIVKDRFPIRSTKAIILMGYSMMLSTLLRSTCKVYTTLSMCVLNGHNDSKNYGHVADLSHV